MPKAPSNSHGRRTVSSPYENVQNTPASSQHSAGFGTVGDSPASAADTSASAAGARSVTSAACLSCRSAKRKCDGERPVCTQCTQRGITPATASGVGGCHYVASKRGGPRYKGVRGAATIAKTEQKKWEKRALAASKASGDVRTAPPPVASSMHGQRSLSRDGTSQSAYSHSPPLPQPQPLPTTAPTLPSSLLARRMVGVAPMHLPPPHALLQTQTDQERMHVGGGGAPLAYHPHALPPPISTGMVGPPPSLGSTGTGQQDSISPALSLLQMSASVPSTSSQPSSERGSPVTMPLEGGLGIGYPTHGSNQLPAIPGGRHPQGWRTSTFPTNPSGHHVRTSSYSNSSNQSHLQQMHPSVAMAAPTGLAPMRNTGDGGSMITHRSASFASSSGHTATSYPSVGGSTASLTSGEAMMNTGSGPIGGTQMPVSHSMAAPTWAASSMNAPGPQFNTTRHSVGQHGTGHGYHNTGSSGPSPNTTIISMPPQSVNLPIPDVYADSMTLVGDLSFEKLEMWSKLQQYQLPSSTSGVQTTAIMPSSKSTTQTAMSLNNIATNAPGAHLGGTLQHGGPLDTALSPSSITNQAHLAFSDFLQKLEALPKAGVVGGAHDGGEHGDAHHHPSAGFSGVMGMDETEDGNNRSGGGGGPCGNRECGDDVGEGTDGVEGAGRLRGTFDTERRVKALLTDYYQLVYPASPVMLPPMHLSSLTFHYCESGPNALHAAISASIAQHLNDSEAQKTLQGDAAWSLALSLGKRGGPVELTRLEVAAHHAASAEMLLLSAEEGLASAGCGPSGVASPHGLGGSQQQQQQQHQSMTASPGCSSSAGGIFASSNPFRSSPPDLELVRIECVAARVLLSQYYYGQCGHRGHKLGHAHALRAWENAQSLVLTLAGEEGGPRSEAVTVGGGGGGDGGTTMGGSHLMSPGGFSPAQKVEWGRRVYHSCFSAVVVLATTGGFEPVQAAQDVLTALQTRPSLGNDENAWGTLIRGSHYVCGTYQALYDLESLRRGDIASSGAVVQSQAEAYAVRNEIFARMSHLDIDMANYCVYDPEWATAQRSAAAGGAGRMGRSRGENDFDADEGAPVFVVEVEKELARSLKIAGKLMTAGSIIILHRAQAFGNARLFMDKPQCGLPAFNTKELAPAPSKDSHESSQDDDDALWHRSKDREASPTESNATSTFTGSGSAFTNTDGGTGSPLFVRGQAPSSVATSAPSTSGSVTSSSKAKASSLFKAVATSQAGGSSSGPGGGSVPAKAFFPPDDRYMGGPFDARVSLHRCKLAAAVMHETFLNQEREKEREMASGGDRRRRLSLTPVLNSDGFGGGGEGTRRQSAYMDQSGDGGDGPSSGARTGEATPRLPPYSACSYVLSAYVWLMLSLLALLGTDDREQAAQQIEMLRSRARSIHSILDRMSASWRNAREYRAEVETLLLANEKLAG
ncbi:unnamed protein product [Tilletia controversa]|nr:hypothetical protein CF336_g5929 [Tilletia laevis]KAE8256533.1 hypothetical protein A4X03_0g5311 [Tilletia caries]CAD6937543.1 unnamed protein product [Tilletia controversa]KAE8195243.1 hypothetical protein CF335_g5141 [Tilletia laevis]CAD6891362.1 unnamed protein product [Tilletia caries]